MVKYLAFLNQGFSHGKFVGSFEPSYPHGKMSVLPLFCEPGFFFEI